MNYAIYKTAVAALEADRKWLSDRLKAFGAGTGPMGLTPDHIKFSRNYRVVRRAYERTSKALRNLNQRYAPLFKSEIVREIQERREAGLREGANANG